MHALSTLRLGQAIENKQILDPGSIYVIAIEADMQNVIYQFV